MPQKQRVLGIWMLTALVVGNMIGSGVFLLPSPLAQYGTITIFSWLITAAGAMLLALVFAKLSMLFPKPGGPYLFCKEGFGPFIGFQVAYNYWIYMWVGNAAIAVACTGYLSVFWPVLTENNLLAFLVTIGFVWTLTLINILGIHFAGICQLVLTICKFIPLALVVFIGIFWVKMDYLAAFNVSQESDVMAFSRGAMLTLWAFLGLESASIPADEAKNPRKTIPFATILGTALAALIYILSTIVIMGVIPMEVLQYSSAPFADLARYIFGIWGARIMGIVAMISCLGALNGWIFLQGQVPRAAAQDALFPKQFKYLSKKRAPVFGIILSSSLITILLIFNFHRDLVGQFTFIISLATLAALISYLYTTITQFLVYTKSPDEKSPSVASLVIASLACLYSFLAIISAGKLIVFYGTLLMLSSVPVYGYINWQNCSKRKMVI